MRYPACILALIAALSTAQIAFAGGAWPRGKGQFFGSVTWSTWGDVLGYLDAIRGPLLEVPRLEMTDEYGLFLEYGLTDRVTIGLDRYDQPGTGIRGSVAFLRFNLGSLDWADKFAAEIGIGSLTDHLGNDDDVLRGGLAWGRGFSTRWSDGWIDVDAKFASLNDSETFLWKIDSTFGAKPDDRNLWYVQVQSGALADYPVYARVVSTYVRRIGHGFSLESALLLGVRNDNAQGAKLGLWYEF